MKLGRRCWTFNCRAITITPPPIHGNYSSYPKQRQKLDTSPQSRSFASVGYSLISTTRQSCPLAFSSAFRWTTAPSSPTSSTRVLDLDFSRRSLSFPSHDHRWLSFPSSLSSHWIIAPSSSVESNSTSSTFPLLRFTIL